MPPGRPAIEEVRALWRQERVPQGTQLQEELLKRNLRSKDELAKRKERKAAELKAAKERADAEKGKKDRTGSIRTWKNTPLGTSDELSEMFRPVTPVSRLLERGGVRFEQTIIRDRDDDQKQASG